MRLRNKPWAQKLVQEHPEAVLNEPDPQKKIDWDTRFKNTNAPLSIEIGSGKGKFICDLAKKYPEINFVGIEIQTTAAGMILRNKLDEKLDNLQIMVADAANLDSFFDANSADVIYLNFSDPWPKNRHEKRRLTYKNFLEKYKTVLKTNGHIEFKTDNSGLFAYSLQSMNNFGMVFDFVSLDLHNSKMMENNVETEYEQKFSQKGNPIFALYAHFKH